MIHQLTERHGNRTIIGGSKGVLHREGTRKVFTEGTVSYQLSRIFNYAYDSPPIHLNDYVVDLKSMNRADFMTSIPRSVLTEIIRKASILGINSFVKFCKQSFIKLYVVE